MQTVTQLQEQLQTLFREVAREAGEASGFIRRQRKLSGESFVSTLVWGWLSNPAATLEELSQMAAVCGVEISAQGLAQRLDERAAACLRAVLEASLSLVASSGEGSPTFLAAFNGVYLLDSTEVPLPSDWQAVWSGGGNQHQARAAMKIQTLWDYQGGRLHFSLHPARCQDVTLPVAALPEGALRISDAGYFDAKQLHALQQQGSFYLLRLPAKVNVYPETGKAWRLLPFLRRYAPAGTGYDGWVRLTAHRLPCRLLALPVPEAVAQQRQDRLRQTAKRKGKTVSRQALALAHWTICVTNVPASRLSAPQVLTLLRLRWQLELLFKLWKQHAHLEHSRSRQPTRILCELYAKLLGLVLQHALLLATCWDVPNRSLVKLAHALRKFVFTLVLVLWLPAVVFQAFFALLRSVLRSRCRLNIRQAQPSHFQLLLSLS